MCTAAWIALVLAFSVPAARAAELAVPAAADADTSLLAPLTPNGRAPTMRASTSGSALVRFDVPATTTKLLRAVLQLPVAQAKGGTIGLQLTQPDWTESSVTYLTAPARVGGSLATVPAPVGAGTISVDVTTSVAAGAKASFAIDRQALDAATFKTRESGAGPKLLVTYAGASQHRLAGMLARPGEGGAARYNATDDLGVRLDALDIVTAPSTTPCGGPPCYLGVHHVQDDGRFTTRLVVSRDLTTWRHVRALDDESSQPSLAVLPDGSLLVAAERDERGPAGVRLGSHVRVQHWPSADVLLSGAPAAATFDAPRQLSSLNEGTPDVAFVDWGGSVAASKIHFGLHWYDTGARIDRAAVATLTGLGGPAPQWQATRVGGLVAALRAMGVAGNVGDRDRVVLDGRALTVVEGQRVYNDFGTWSLYVVDATEKTAERVEMTTPGHSASVGNPSVELLTLPDGRPGMAATAFVFNEGSGAGEAGELVAWRPL